MSCCTKWHPLRIYPEEQNHQCDILLMHYKGVSMFSFLVPKGKMRPATSQDLIEHHCTSEFIPVISHTLVLLAMRCSHWDRMVLWSMKYTISLFQIPFPTLGLIMKAVWHLWKRSINLSQQSNLPGRRCPHFPFLLLKDIFPTHTASTYVFIKCHNCICITHFHTRFCPSIVYPWPGGQNRGTIRQRQRLAWFVPLPLFRRASQKFLLCLPFFN